MTLTLEQTQSLRTGDILITPTGSERRVAGIEIRAMSRRIILEKHWKRQGTVTYLCPQLVAMGYKLKRAQPGYVEPPLEFVEVMYYPNRADLIELCEKCVKV